MAAVDRIKGIQQQAALTAAVAPRDTIVAFLSPYGPQAVSGRFARSLASATHYDGYSPVPEHHGRIGGVMHQEAGPMVGEARDGVVKAFLDTDADYLVFVDADMEFPETAIHNLLDCARPVERPVVGGLCFGGAPGRMFPTLYVFNEHDDGLETVGVSDYPDEAMIRVGATGAAFLCIHRDVFVKLGDTWFTRTMTDHLGRAMPEDIGFCARLHAEQIPVLVHTGIQVGHHKSVVLDAAMYRLGIPQSSPK